MRPPSTTAYTSPVVSSGKTAVNQPRSAQARTVRLVRGPPAATSVAPTAPHTSTTLGGT